MYGTPDAERLLPQFEQFAANAYAGNSVVFALIGKRLALFSEATFRFQALKDKRMYGTTALAKLENPWLNGSTGELLARMEQDVSLAGNCYIRDAGDRLERLRPDWVTIVSLVSADAMGRQVREVIGYYFEPVGDPDRANEFYPVNEVAHWSPIPDPLANFRGMSWLTPVIREINADVSMSAHRDSFFRNGATPNVVVKYQQKLKQEQRDDIRDAIAARHAGSENAFTTMVLDQGADLTVVGANMEGSAFTALQAAGELRIAAAAMVPPRIAGISAAIQTGVPRPGELADDMRLFVDGTLRPNWRTACAALSVLVTVPSGSKLWFDTSDISALRQGETDAATTMQLNASTANTLIMAGYDPDAVVQAITAGDMSILSGQHSGLTSVQMHAPGEKPPAPPVQTGDPMASADATATAEPAVAKGTGRHRSVIGHTGAMIALIPTDTDAERLAVPGGERADELHVTLAYLGEGADYSDYVRQALHGTIAATVAEMGPVEADGSALTVFNPGDANDLETCIVLGLTGPDLRRVHDAVARVTTNLLAITGPEFPDQHDPWIPHLTLTFTDDVSQLATLTSRVGPVTFDRIRLAFAGDNIDIPLFGD